MAASASPALALATYDPAATSRFFIAQFSKEKHAQWKRKVNNQHCHFGTLQHVKVKALEMGEMSFNAPPSSRQLELKPLPYPLDALEPYMKRETVESHWGTHQRSHVETLNGMIGGSEWESMELEDMVVSSFSKGRVMPNRPFIHAAQIWNHEFFWDSMRPGGGGKPSGRLMELIERDFGSFEKMIQELKDAAMSQFGSGWAWLSYKANTLYVGNAINPRPSERDKKLVISKTPNAVNPLVWDYSPVLAIDVWEHAYYLDYENCREDYVSIFLDKLVCWEIVGSRLDAAIARADKAAEGQKMMKRVTKTTWMT